MKIAMIQMGAGSDPKHNLNRAIALVKDAISGGAKWILLPEVFVGRNIDDLGQVAHLLPGPFLQPFLALAKQHGVWILAGSIYEQSEKPPKVYNTSVLIDQTGAVNAAYRKIHLFDVQVERRVIRESDHYLAGKQPVIGEVDGVKVGLSICYDLRFPELYRYYSHQGAQILTVPSSFTQPTGKAHWEALVRARAIENQCFVLAPNQVGVGAGGVETYGHSLAVDPWGTVLAYGSGTDPQIVTCELDFDYLHSVRQSFPSLKHRKL